MAVNDVGQRSYNDPAGGSQSHIGAQIRTDHFIKKALVEVKKEQYFSPLASSIAMPKNMGKKIKQYIYVPLLDDANITDQGLDAAGLDLTKKATIKMQLPGRPDDQRLNLYGVGVGADDAAATTAAKADAMNIFKDHGIVEADYAASVTAAEALTPPWVIDDTTYAAGGAVPSTGNLYGSSKDIGTIVGKMPMLSEHGGRVNRVGFTRVELEGTIEKYGFFDEYTQESLDFDSDAELSMHINREMIFGANEITEDLLQIDLLNSCGVIYFAGDATADSELSGETGAITEVTYADLSRLSVELDDNRCPKHTKIIAGSRMIDTKVIRAGRIMYVGSELTLTLEQMTDHFNNQAFVNVSHYADAGSPINGELGTVGQFRMIVVPEMMHWAGAGADVTNNDGYRESNDKYNVYPMLVVGDQAFTTIGFQTSGKTVKFVIKHSKPGSPESFANDVYGETGFMSIKWYYGFLALRPERLAVLKTIAKM